MSKLIKSESNLLGAGLDAPLIGVNPRWPKVWHAIEMGEVIRSWPDKTAEGACGKKFLRPLAVRDPDGFVLAGLWPPHKRQVEARGHERCAECFELTGKMRPRSKFAEAQNGHG